MTDKEKLIKCLKEIDIPYTENETPILAMIEICIGNTTLLFDESGDFVDVEEV
jgi:hypothetical protein